MADGAAGWEVPVKVSTRGRYGLRVMMELAARFGAGPVLVETIARNQSISGKYIHVLVTSLKAAQLVRATRGPNGGYELARAPGSITALEVIAALEGKNAPVECVVDRTACERTNDCVARELWCEVAQAMDQVLASRTLEELAARQAMASRGETTYEI